MHPTMEFSQLPNEIFDIILATLHYKDLLRCERVSKTWCKLIRDGHRTSKTLFRYRKSMKDNPDPNTRRNYLEEIWNARHTSKPAESESLAGCVAHPLLNLLVRKPEQSSIDRDGRFWISRDDLLDAIGGLDGHANPTASWRSMFTTWPPLYEMEIQIIYHRPRHPGAMRSGIDRNMDPGVVKTSRGITLNHFFYALYRCSEPSLRGLASTRAPMPEWVNSVPRVWVEKVPSSVYLQILPTVPVKKDQMAEAGQISRRE